MAVQSSNLQQIPLWLRMQANKARLRLNHSALVIRTRQIRNAKRLEPSFIIVGAQKAGTTFLYSVLAQHPEIMSPWTKEVHFFDIANRYRHGEQWYRAFFPISDPAGRPFKTFEATPSYSFHPLAAERIAKMLPDAKLIFLLREPASRAWSHYQMRVFARKESLPFRDAIDREEERTAHELEKILRDPLYPGNAYCDQSYVKRGLYLEQLLRLEEHFPKENILVLDSGRLSKDTDTVLAEVERFAGLSNWTPPKYVPKNVAKVNGSGDDEALAYLRDYYRPHNLALFEHLGWENRW